MWRKSEAAGIRVALVCCSGLLGGLIRETVAALPDVGRIRRLPAVGGPRLVRSLRRFQPDVVVWRMDDDRMLSEHLEFFGVRHRCSVLAVLDDGEHGTLWRLSTQRAELGPLSPNALAAAVRSGVVDS